MGSPLLTTEGKARPSGQAARAGDRQEPLGHEVDSKFLTQFALHASRRELERGHDLVRYDHQDRHEVTICRGVPRNKLIRWGNNLYFGKIVPKIGALLSDGAAYRYLPKSVAYLPPPATMLADLRSAGFTDAEHHQLTGGITQLLLGTRS